MELLKTLQVALLEEMAANGETLNEDMLNYPDQSGRVSAIWGMVEGRALSTWVPALIISLQMFLETTISLLLVVHNSKLYFQQAHVKSLQDETNA